MTMNVSVPVPVTESRDSRAPFLEHERLHVYQAALEFHALACTLVPRRGFSALRDQLERASLSAVLCIAEGAGRTSQADKRRFYEMARGSATESAAALDVLRVRGLIDASRYRPARDLVLRVVQMLSRLCSRRGHGYGSRSGTGTDTGTDG
jgi:four helix bundle protein